MLDLTDFGKKLVEPSAAADTGACPPGYRYVKGENKGSRGRCCLPGATEGKSCVPVLQTKPGKGKGKGKSKGKASGKKGKATGPSAPGVCPTYNHMLTPTAGGYLCCDANNPTSCVPPNHSALCPSSQPFDASKKSCCDPKDPAKCTSPLDHVDSYLDGQLEPRNAKYRQCPRDYRVDTVKKQCCSISPDSRGTCVPFFSAMNDVMGTKGKGATPPPPRPGGREYKGCTYTPRQYLAGKWLCNSELYNKDVGSTDVFGGTDKFFMQCTDTDACAQAMKDEIAAATQAKETFTTPTKSTWVCPSGKTWGWGANKGKCCDKSNKNCVGSVNAAAQKATTKPAAATGSGGGVAWVCPAGKTWGWGANNGKCCDKSNKNCVGTVTRAPTGGSFCPTGTSWGWGSNAGKCCVNNAKCVNPLKSVAYQGCLYTKKVWLNNGWNCPDDFPRDTLDWEHVGADFQCAQKPDCVQKIQGQAAPKKAAKASKPAAEGSGFCPPGTAWGWGANAGKCCVNNANCVGSVNPTNWEGCYYTKKVWKDNGWNCPDEYPRDTGDWSYVNANYQCASKSECVTKVQNAAAPAKKAANTLKLGDWICPPGYSWGWDQNAGKCCMNNYSCREAIQFGEPACKAKGLFLCENDVDRDGGVHNYNKQKALEFKGTGICCKYTNRGCGGNFWNGLRDAGMKGSGYYTADDGCNVEVFDYMGNPIATNGKSIFDVAAPIAGMVAGSVAGMAIGNPALGMVAGAAIKGGTQVGLSQLK